MIGCRLIDLQVDCTGDHYYISFAIIKKNLIGVQVGRMGYIPACGGTGNSRNVSCSKPSTATSALGKERYVNG